MSNIQLVESYISKLAPDQITTDSAIVIQFKRNFSLIHGTSGDAQYEKEQFYFNKLLAENPDLRQCTPLSLYNVFMEISANGLSLDNTSKPLCYVVWRSFPTGRKDERGYSITEKRAVLMVTGYGELVQRQRAGQIKYADNPVIVYKGDHFKAGIDKQGNKYVEYEAKIPRESKHIIACFIKISRPNGSTDYQWLLEDDFDRLKMYSERSNSKWVEENGKKKRVPGDANALYSSHIDENGLKQIDPGFLENKMIKHAFDAFPKVRTAGAVYETDLDPDQKTEDIQAEEVKDDMSFADNAPQAEPATVVIQPTADDESF